MPRALHVVVTGSVRAATPCAVRGLRGGTDPARTGKREVQLESDDTLLMFTDGLVERRDSSVEDLLGHLVSAAASPAGDPDRQLDRLLAESRSDMDDDTCVIGIRVG
ncbi:protein phosphatase 2C domain protein [Actinobacteria bacterium OV450]|nr:protein phosphatase 2C domain protein [Actinobacteria bacterium OV450]